MSFTIPNSFVQDTPAKAGDVNENFDAVQKAIESLEEALIPVGAIMATGGSGAPGGYLMCNGEAVSRTKYAALFGVIGGAFGVGDGGTTFNLPDMRGRVPVGVGGASVSRTLGPEGLGQSGGNYWLQQHAHFFNWAGGTSFELGPHTHFLGWEAINQHFSLGEQAANFVFQAGGTHTTAEEQPHNHSVNIQGWTNNEGLGGSQNMQPYQCVNYMIKH